MKKIRVQKYEQTNKLPMWVERIWQSSVGKNVGYDPFERMISLRIYKNWRDVKIHTDQSNEKRLSHSLLYE